MPLVTPQRLNLKKDEHLQIDWLDGSTNTYSLSLLRTMCPCAQCRIVREGKDPHQLLQSERPKPKLTMLPGNFAVPLTVVAANLVGNYALKIQWSDNHEAGIYSFEYLKEIGRA